MKVYLIQHTSNEAYELCRSFTTDSVFSSMKKARGYLKKIKSDIESGTSPYFPDTRITARKYTGVAEGYTFPWISYDGKHMFTHFYIVKKELS